MQAQNGVGKWDFESTYLLINSVKIIIQKKINTSLINFSIITFCKQILSNVQYIANIFLENSAETQLMARIANAEKSSKILKDKI